MEMLKTAQQNSSEAEKLFLDHCTQLHTQTGELMCRRLQFCELKFFGSDNLTKVY